MGVGWWVANVGMSEVNSHLPVSYPMIAVGWIGVVMGSLCITFGAMYSIVGAIHSVFRHGSLPEDIEHVSEQFGLSDDEKKTLLPSGKQAVIDNRVGWARTYLSKAGLLVSPRRGYFKITNEGVQVLISKPQRIDVKYLEQFPSFLEFRNIKLSQN